MNNAKPRVPLKGGDEYDALTGWRKVYGFRPGVRAAIKRKYNRRLRRIMKVIWPNKHLDTR